MDELKYHTSLNRLGAAIVDWIIFLPLLLFQQWLYARTNNTSIIIAWIIFTTFVPIFYSIIAHYKYGQTVGKWVAGVKVVDISESKKLTLRQCLLRDIFDLTTQIIGLAYFSFLAIQTDKTEFLLIDYASFADGPMSWWFLIELITMLTNSKRRAAHDYIAGTVVIKV